MKLTAVLTYMDLQFTAENGKVTLCLYEEYFSKVCHSFRFPENDDENKMVVREINARYLQSQNSFKT